MEDLLSPTNPTATRPSGRLRVHDAALRDYTDVLTPAALDTLEALVGFNADP